LPVSLTPAQEQLLLGTLLGDGCLAAVGVNPRLRSRHGWVQRDYNYAKYQVLSAFVRTPPKKAKNSGYGTWSCVWATLSLPVFAPYLRMCYPGGQKRIVTEWLDRLTWEAVAWWYQDDGGLHGKACIFNTQAFPQQDVELLAAWLTRRGIRATARRVRAKRRNKTYWIVALGVQATRKLFDHIRPWVVPSMLYKITLPTCHTVLTCHWCQQQFQLTPGQIGTYQCRRRPICQDPQCWKKRQQVTREKYLSAPGKRAARNAKARGRYYANLAESRERARQNTAAYNRRHPDRAKAAKQRHLAAKQAARKLRPWACQRCQLQEPQGERDTRTKYCLACKTQLRRERQALAYVRQQELRASRGQADTGCST